MRTRPTKRSSFGGESPPGILVEKRQKTSHRRYSKISDDARRLTINFSLKVANYILERSLAAAENDPKNVVCSPLSIDVVLNIVALGAEGPTLKQLLEVLGCDGVHDFNLAASKLADVIKDPQADDGLQISFANALWVDQRYNLKTSFQEVLGNVHKAEAKAVDFVNKVDEVVNEVNLWAEEVSKGFIKKIISRGAISKDTTMLLVNALYFRGTWVDKFKAEDSEEGDFYLLNGNKVKVPFMTQAYTKYDYGAFEGCQILRMLYEEEEVSGGEISRSFSMYILLPETKDGLPNLLEKLQMDSNMFKDKVQLSYEEIDNLSVPKFNFECELPISEPMKQLGLTLPFDEHCKDLIGIVDTPSGENLYVSDIIQNCRVEIDEEGTKAAAFTRVELLCGCLRPPTPPPPINFVADHPFLFMIREDISGAVLFVGTMLNPLQS